MTLLVRAFPLRCDRAEVMGFVEELQKRSDETRRFYNSFSVRRESWFFQDSVHFPMVIGVTDVAAAPLDPLAEEFATTVDGFANWFKARVYQLSGVDEDEEPLGPPTEMLFDSSGARLPDGVVLSARIYPVRSREALDSFVRELGDRRNETSAFYERFEVPREVWYLQETKDGPVVIGVTAMNAPDRASEYAETDEAFAAWFKRRVVEVTGVDPNVTPLGPPSEQVFDFQA